MSSNTVRLKRSIASSVLRSRVSKHHCVRNAILLAAKYQITFCDAAKPRPSKIPADVYRFSNNKSNENKESQYAIRSMRIFVEKTSTISLIKSKLRLAIIARWLKKRVSQQAAAKKTMAFNNAMLFFMKVNVVIKPCEISMGSNKT